MTDPVATSLALSARGLHKAYGAGSARVVALAGVDVDVRRGELLAITGPSGSGKTTLLHCLAGLVAPDDGHVLLDDVDLAALDDDARTDLRARSMGFVFQSLNLLPALTVGENVELPLVLRGLRADEVRGRAAAALGEVGLADRAKAYPAQLSGGEQQRVAIARAVAGEPAVLWADEPTGALDSGAAHVVLDLLRRLVDGGATVVVVTHDADVAARADRIVALRDGRVVDEAVTATS